MARSTKRAGGPRPARARQRLSPDRILRAAMRLADRSGVEALSMRRLARALGVEAMSLYKHVADKDAVLDGLVDLVVGEIGMPLEAAGWTTALRHHAVATRQACLRHRWAAVLMEVRGASTPSRMRYADALLGLLRRAGFTVPTAYRAFLLVDSYVYGFITQEVGFPSDDDEMAQLSAVVTSQFPRAEYPALAEAMSYIMASTASGRGLPGLTGLYDAEFEHGLELILDGLERVHRNPEGDQHGARATSAIKKGST